MFSRIIIFVDQFNEGGITQFQHHSAFHDNDNQGWIDLVDYNIYHM